jgi:hypothetical protein
MELQHAYCSHLKPVLIVETFVSQSTSVRPVDPFVESTFVLYTNRIPEYRPADRVLSLFPDPDPDFV